MEGIVVVDGWSGEDSIVCEDSRSVELDAWENSVRKGDGYIQSSVCRDAK